VALSASICWEVRTTGNDANGGGCKGNGSNVSPSAPSVSKSNTGGTVAANTYYVVTTYWNGVSDGPKSAESSVTTTGTTSTITVQSPAASSGMFAFSVWIGTTSGGPYFLQGTAGGNILGASFTRSTTPATTGTRPVGVDRCLSDNPFVTFDGTTITASTSGASATVTLSGVTGSQDDIGNVVQISGGANFTAGFYEIIQATSTTWTFDKNCCAVAASGMTGRMGGALATITTATTPGIAGHRVFIKNGTYNETVAPTVNMSYWGYNTTRYDNPTDNNRPLIDGQNSRANCFNGTVNSLHFLRIANATGSGLNNSQSGCHIEWVKSTGNGSHGFTSNGVVPMGFAFCESASNGGNGFNVGSSMFAKYCWSHDNTGSGYNCTNNGSVFTASFCVASQNGSHGFATSNSVMCSWSFCVSYGNTGASTDGFSNAFGFMENCISMNNGRYGLNSVFTVSTNYNCYYGNGTAALFNLKAYSTNDIFSDPLMVDPGNATASSRDFKLQATSPCLGTAYFPIVPGSAT
jgi:hypothetical protein